MQNIKCNWAVYVKASKGLDLKKKSGSTAWIWILDLHSVPNFWNCFDLKKKNVV